MNRFLWSFFVGSLLTSFIGNTQIDDSTLNKLSDTSSFDQNYKLIIKDAYIIHKTNPTKSLQYALELEKDTAKVKDRVTIAAMYRLMAHSYGDLNNRPATLRAHIRRQEVLQNPKTDIEKKFLAAAYYETGAVLTNQDDEVLAIPYFEKCIDLCLSINDIITAGQAQIELGVIYAGRERKEEGVQLILEGADVFRNTPYEVLVSYAQIEVAKVHQKMGNLPLSWTYADSALNTIGDPDAFPDYSGLVYAGAANILLEAKNYQEAIKTYEKAKAVMEKHNKFFYLPEAYRGLSQAYKSVNPDSSIKYLEKYVELNDSVLTIENNKKIAELQIIHDEQENKREIRLLNEKNKIKEREKELIKKDNEQQKAQNRKQQQIIWIGVISLVIVLGLLFFVFRLFNVSKRQNSLIANQKRIVEEKNKEITDSINYAQRIQTAIMPSKSQIAKLFPDSFVLYMPKDKLSGDFYWCGTAVNNDDLNLKVFAVGDCTGHGIPGALVSILGLNYLKLGKSDKSVNSPAQALDFMNQGIFSIFESDEETIRDGMDISIAAIDDISMMMYYASAKNPIFIVRAGNIHVLKGDKHPIGKSDYDHPEPFTDLSFQLESGDMIYMCSDGYQDQFGGPSSSAESLSPEASARAQATVSSRNGKKFKVKKLKVLMVELSNKDCADQKDIFEKTIINWKGNLEQLDDICLFGIRV